MQIIHVYKYSVLTDLQEVHVISMCLNLETDYLVSGMDLQTSCMFRLRCKISPMLNQVNRLI